MDVALSVDGDGSDETLAQLQEWFRHESELSGRVTPVQRPPQPGELGVVTDMLSLALGSGGALSVLAASLRAWFSQPRRANIRIKLQTPDGRIVEIDAARVKDVESLLASAFGQTGGA